MSRILIQQAMAQSIADYLNYLDGEKVTGLHNLMMSEAEAALIAIALEHCGGNQTHTATLLGISRNTLKKKMHLYAIGKE